MTTTDTPRTDAELEKPRDGVYSSFFSMASHAKQLEREITEIRNALGDDGRRTHKEILEMAFKASGWKLWKEKYINLKNAHIAEGQDPAGTIWEHADRIQQELKASKAEAEFYKKSVKAYVDACEPIRGMADKLGLRLGECIIQHGVPLLLESHKKAVAEVERLGGLLYETRSLLTEFHDCVDIGGLHDGDCNISTEDPEKWERGCNCTTAELRRKYIKLYSK